MHVFHAIFSGRVQGVGFRYSTLRIANEFGVSGWVRNLSNGGVEVFAAHAEKDALDRFIAKLRATFERNIVSVKTLPSEPDEAQGFSGFRILPTK